MLWDTREDGSGIVTQPMNFMPCLDMRNGRMTKGVHFVDICDAGGTPVTIKSFGTRTTSPGEGGGRSMSFERSSTTRSKPPLSIWMEMETSTSRRQLGGTLVALPGSKIEAILVENGSITLSKRIGVARIRSSLPT